MTSTPVTAASTVTRSKTLDESLNSIPSSKYPLNLTHMEMVG